MKRIFPHRASSAALLLSVALLTACSESEITSYRVPKDKEPEPAVADSPASSAASAAESKPAASGAGMTGPAVATATGAGLAWSAPTHWQTKPGGAMRKGSYVVAGEGTAVAELAITAFPGDVGGEVANVNRWRGQLQLPPLPEKDVTPAITRLHYNGLTLSVVDFANPTAATPQRIVGAMVPIEGATWFFKLTGPDALVAKEKPAFLDFLKTVKLAASTPTR